MKLVSTRSLALTAAAGFLAATATFVAGDASAPVAPSTRSEEVRIQKVIVRESGDNAPAAGQSIFLKSRAVTGEEPTIELTVIGEGGQPEVFDVGDLEVGDSRSFETAGGKSIDVTRTDAGMALVVDGKTIALPEMDGDAKVMAFATDGAPGAHEVRVMKVMSHDGQVITENELGPDVMTWTSAAPAIALAGSMDFDKLESLKDLDPEVREKVVAALKEIMATPHVIAVDVNTTTAPAAIVDPGTSKPRRAPIAR